MTVTLPPLAVGIVLLSALLHATWNMLLARLPRGLDTTMMAMLVGFVAWAPIAIARWRVEAGAWPLLAASAGFELAYFVALNFAYGRAPAHAVYPVARGLAPTLLLTVVVLTGGRLGAWAGLGVLGVSLGVLLTARSELRWRSVLPAVPVAICTAGYTYIDAFGLRHADPAPYLWLKIAPVGLVLLAFRLVRARPAAEQPDGERRDGLVAQLRWSTVVMGLGMYCAYGLALVALSLVPVTAAPAVAALRETSILFVLGLSWLAGRRSATEPRRPPPTLVTAAGAVLILAGVVTIGRAA